MINNSYHILDKYSMSSLSYLRISGAEKNPVNPFKWVPRFYNKSLKKWFYLNFSPWKMNTKNYKNRTFTCSHDRVVRMRFTLMHWKSRGKTQYMRDVYSDTGE